MEMSKGPIKVSGTTSDRSDYNSDPQPNQESDEEHIPGQSSITTRRNKRKYYETSPIGTSKILTEIRNLFENFESKQNAKIDNLLANINTVKSQNEDMKKSVEFLSQKYDEFVSKVDCLEKETLDYKKLVHTLESKIELMERNSRASIIEIKNIPAQQAESSDILRNIVKDIGSTIGQPIIDSDVQQIYRLKTKQEKTNHLVVKFNNTSLKDSIIKKVRQFNKENKENKLNTSHIHLPTQGNQRQPIYIDEALTSKARRLRFLAKELVTNKQLHSSWTAYGKVFVRKTENSTPTRIEEEEELRNFV